jgi:hypothetical protein
MLYQGSLERNIRVTMIRVQQFHANHCKLVSFVRGNIQYTKQTTIHHINDNVNRWS